MREASDKLELQQQKDRLVELKRKKEQLRKGTTKRKKVESESEDDDDQDVGEFNPEALMDWRHKGDM